jgi:hypothetical protein
VLRGARVGGVLLIGLVLAAMAGGATPPGTRAASADDPADIVLVLDFSGSILDDDVVRAAFADALDGIATRVEETADTRACGDATVSIVRFATRAADVPGCTGLSLRESEATVATLAACLRDIAGAYRRGVDPALLDEIGDDTNYVAAIEAAATHLPAGLARPAIIFFTDGRHEADGVPVSEVVPARDRLFRDRSPFALLPVGLGIDPDDRPQLEAGLANLRITRAFERCDGGLLEWPAVVFDSAETAGRAVALALQDVSCTFTVEPSGPPPASQTPASPTPAPLAAVQGVFLVPGNERIEVGWGPPRDVEQNPVDDYLVRCRPVDGGEWIESSEGVSTETTTMIEGLENGTEYECEVAAVRASGADGYTRSNPAAPFGRPPTPAKPSLGAGNGAIRVSVEPPDGPVDGYRWECSADGGATWDISRESEGREATFDIGGLINGTGYVCRVFATNESGVSDASPVSDIARPCGGIFECSPWAVPVVGGLGAAFAFVLVQGLWRWYAGRRVYVTLELDRFPPIDLGQGPTVGLGFVRRGYDGRVHRLVPATGREAEYRFRYKGGDRFDVEAGGRSYKAEVARAVRIPDSTGELHDIVLRIYDEDTRSPRRAEEDATA